MQRSLVRALCYKYNPEVRLLGHACKIGSERERGSDPAFPHLFCENPASRATIIAISKIISFSRDSEISENFAYRIRNPSFCNPEYSSRNPKSHWRLQSRIQLLLTNTGIQYLESGIHSIESRIQDCPRSLTWDEFSFPMSCNVTLWIRGQQDVPSLLTNMLIVISDVSRPGATGSRYQSIHKLTVTHP